MEEEGGRRESHRMRGEREEVWVEEKMSKRGSGGRLKEEAENLKREAKWGGGWVGGIRARWRRGSRVRHYRQNRGRALNPLPLFRRHGPRMKKLGFVILICFSLSSAELTEENIKVFIVFERSMRRHKAFCSCAQRIIHKLND